MDEEEAVDPTGFSVFLLDMLVPIASGGKSNTQPNLAACLRQSAIGPPQEEYEPGNTWSCIRFWPRHPVQ